MRCTSTCALADVTSANRARAGTEQCKRGSRRRLPVRHDTLARRERKNEPWPHCLCASQMISINVTKPALDIRKSRIGRDSIGDQSADTRPAPSAPTTVEALLLEPSVKYKLCVPSSWGRYLPLYGPIARCPQEATPAAACEARRETSGRPSKPSSNCSNNTLPALSSTRVD